MSDKKYYLKQISEACDKVVEAIDIIYDAIDCLERIGLPIRAVECAKEDIIGSLTAAIDSGISVYPKKDIDYNLSALITDIEEMEEICPPDENEEDDLQLAKDWEPKE